MVFLIHHHWAYMWCSIHNSIWCHSWKHIIDWANIKPIEPCIYRFNVFWCSRGIWDYEVIDKCFYPSKYGIFLAEKNDFAWPMQWKLWDSCTFLIPQSSQPFSGVVGFFSSDKNKVKKAQHLWGLNQRLCGIQSCDGEKNRKLKRYNHSAKWPYYG